MFEVDLAIGKRMADQSGQLSSKKEKAVIVFDAECILCSANAKFVLKHDRDRRFMLASMQGEYGQNLYEQNGIDPTNPETLIVVQGDIVLRNSDAVLSIYGQLGWPWKTVKILHYVPRFLRDPIYLFIARNRYQLIGKRDTCWLPTSQYLDRML